MGHDENLVFLRRRPEEIDGIRKQSQPQRANNARRTAKILETQLSPDADHLPPSRPAVLALRPRAFRLFSNRSSS